MSFALFTYGVACGGQILSLPRQSIPLILGTGSTAIPILETIECWHIEKGEINKGRADSPGISREGDERK